MILIDNINLKKIIQFFDILLCIRNIETILVSYATLNIQARFNNLLLL